MGHPDLPPELLVPESELDSLRFETPASQVAAPVGRDILLVDDNMTNLVAIEAALGPLGRNLVLARSGTEALGRLLEQDFALILLDVAMPDMDGWAAGRALRRIPHDRPAIVMLSAFAPDPKHKADPDPINDDYLIKPFDLRQLLGKIHALLDIEWVHDTTSLNGQIFSGNGAAAPSLKPETIPPPGEIEELIRLIQIGYVRGIEEKLNTIERNPAHQDFVTYMRVLTDDFDLKRCVVVLESFRDGHG